MSDSNLKFTAENDFLHDILFRLRIKELKYGLFLLKYLKLLLFCSVDK